MTKPNLVRIITLHNDKAPVFWAYARLMDFIDAYKFEDVIKLIELHDDAKKKILLNSLAELKPLLHPFVGYIEMCNDNDEMALCDLEPMLERYADKHFKIESVLKIHRIVDELEAMVG